MTQKLILPINNCELRIGKNSGAFTKYCERQLGATAIHSIGYTLSDTSTNSGVTIWASGNGTVLESGTDVNFGNVVIIKYSSCTLRSGVVKDSIIRYYDLASQNVSKGQSVTKDIKIGTTGRLGRFCPEGYGRVRIEIDTDTQYPAYSPSVLSGWSQGIIKKGTNSTMLDMNQVLFIKRTAPDYQNLKGATATLWQDSLTGQKHQWYGETEAALSNY